MRLFVLLSRFPYPLEKGDKLRAFHQIRTLSEHHTVFLCALDEEEVAGDRLSELTPFCEEIQTIRLPRFRQLLNVGCSLFTSEPFQVAYFFQKAALQQVRACINRWQPDAIYCQLLRTAKYVEQIPSIPKVIDLQDAFSKGIERRLETDPWYYRPVLISELKRLQRYEEQVFQTFDRCTIISEQDRAQLPFSGRGEVTVVRNGVDTGYFQPQDKTYGHDILFVGNMGYPPNVEGAIFLEKKIMPIVRARHPGARLMLAGARPAPQVKELASELTRVTGWVDDIRDCYAEAKVFVAPMNIGTGLQNKLLEAMAMRVPCITSKLANNAIEADPGSEILIAETAEEYANHILSLLKDQERAQQIAAAGHQLVLDKFSWEGATRPLLQILEEV